jgi:hypothetical protein
MDGAPSGTKFQDAIDKTTTSNLQAGTKEAIDWFRKTALSLNNVKSQKILSANMPFKRFQTLNEKSIGKMYMFVYDAKTKNLPYFDAFPLIFPIEFYGDSFLGINLHYLPPKLRAKLMDALYSTINNQKFDNTTILKLSYQILSKAGRFKYFKPCVKKYLVSQVGSPFIYVSPDEWDFALMLPTENFQGASKQQVFRDSQLKV